MVMTKKKRAGIAGAAALASALFASDVEAQWPVGVGNRMVMQPPVVMPFAYPYNFPLAGVPIPFGGFQVGFGWNDPRGNRFLGVAMNNMFYPFGHLPPWLSYMDIEYAQMRNEMRFGPPNGAGPFVYGTNQTLPEFTGAQRNQEAIMQEFFRNMEEKYASTAAEQLKQAEQNGYERGLAATPAKPIHKFGYDVCITKDRMPVESASLMNDYFAALGNNDFSASVEGSGAGAFVQINDITGGLYQIKFDQFGAADSMSKLTDYLFDTATARHGKNPNSIMTFSHRPYIAEGCNRKD